LELKPRGYDKVVALLKKGVKIPNPLTLDIGDEVEVSRISPAGVTIYPGCRLYGPQTVICEGAQIGLEGPVTIENCQVGPKVHLKGGYFKESVFLDGAHMGLGAHVREGCILEEQSGGAHCVGLKQTILFPFVTLGSLINFCDCLMAGGTHRKNHSEVGSSYIHFNFTPEGDKTTPSLIGDVPRGVMINQPPIFLGGQGGMVGPLRMGYGNVVAAGGILRRDFTQGGKLIIPRPHRGAVLDYSPGGYGGLGRILKNNFLYIANILALDQWYLHVRKPFLLRTEHGSFLWEGARRNLALGVAERIKRLRIMAEKIGADQKDRKEEGSLSSLKENFSKKAEEIFEYFTLDRTWTAGKEFRDRFLEALHRKGALKDDYINAIQALPRHITQEGTRWLEETVNSLYQGALAILES